MNKILDEFDETLEAINRQQEELEKEPKFWGKGIKEKSEEYELAFNKALTKQKSDIFSKICEHFDIGLDDLPAFQDKDIIDLVLIVGKVRYDREMFDKIKQNVGSLRQWLNEDRIKDADKMVTNEQIIYWLLDKL